VKFQTQCHIYTYTAVAPSTEPNKEKIAKKLTGAISVEFRRQITYLV